MQHENKTDSSKIEISQELTIPKLFFQQAKKFGKDRVAMREKEFGIWRPITWHDYLENVKYLALGLISLGLEDGDKVSMIGDNRPEGLWAEMATLCARGVGVWLFQDCLIDEVRYIIDHSDTRFLFGEGQEEVDKACKALSSREKAQLVCDIPYQYCFIGKNWTCRLSIDYQLDYVEESDLDIPETGDINFLNRVRRADLHLEVTNSKIVGRVKKVFSDLGFNVLTGFEVQTGVPVTFAFPGKEEIRYHSVDTDQDWVISAFELNRIVGFYNAGGYHCHPGSQDGFAPGVGAQDCEHHDADYRDGGEWVISAFELSRIISFYNS